MKTYIVLVGLLATAMPAHAQVVTVSPSELVQMASQLRQMQQDYEVYKGIFGTLLREVDPNNIASGLIGSQPLPGVGQIGQVMTGGGNFGSLSGLAGQYMQANTVYTPQSTGPDDFNAGYMQRTGNTLSGVQAMLQQSIGSIQQHITGITEIQGQLSTVTTQADVAAINGRLQAEQANLAAQGTQAQSLQTMMMAQQQQYELQQMQNQRRSADALLESVTGGTGPTQPATTVPTFTGG